ncbi:MAG: hypothetical protein JO340_12725 [Acidobacteriaceae bacterium]|nr:hypothetical protein [Acidobacteriaceae bacterium]
MDPTILIRLAVVSLASQLLYASAGIEAPNSLDIPVPSFSQTDTTAYMVAMNLSITYSVPIGFEGVPEDPEKSITITVSSSTIRGVLDELAMIDPRYEWRVGSDGVINIFPRRRSEALLDVKIAGFRVERVNRQQAIGTLLYSPEIARALTSLRVTERTPVTADTYQNTGSIPVFSLSLEGVSMRTALDAITRASGSLFWAATLYGKDLHYLSLTIAGSAPATLHGEGNGQERQWRRRLGAGT